MATALSTNSLPFLATLLALGRAGGSPLPSSRSPLPAADILINTVPINGALMASSSLTDSAASRTRDAEASMTSSTPSAAAHNICVSAASDIGGAATTAHSARSPSRASNDMNR